MGLGNASATTVPSTSASTEAVEPNSFEWNWNDLHRQPCILDVSEEAAFKPCFEAARSSKLKNVQGRRPPKRIIMSAIWGDLPRPLVDMVVAKLPGKELVKCAAVDKSFAAMLSGATPTLRRLLPSFTPQTATATGLPLLVAAGMPSWFDLGHVSASSSSSTGWKKLSSTHAARSSTPRTAMSIWDCSYGLLLLACKHASASWNRRDFFLVNPVIKEKVRVDVMGAVATEMAGKYKTGAMDVIDAKMHVTLVVEEGEEEGARTTVVADLFVKLRVYYIRQPRTAWESQVLGCFDLYLHLVYGESLGGAVVRSASAGPGRGDPDEVQECGGTGEPRRPLHVLLRMLLPADAAALSESVVEKEVSSVVVGGRFYSLHLCCPPTRTAGGNGNGHRREEDYYLALLECDFRHGGSAWHVTKVVKKSVEEREVTCSVGKYRRLHLVAWRGRMAVVDIVLGTLHEERSHVSPYGGRGGRGGIVRISLKQLQRVEEEEDVMYRLVPAPGFVEYHGSPRDVSGKLARALDRYVRGNPTEEEDLLVVSVVSCGVDGGDLFCSWAFLKVREPLQKGMTPPETMYYKGAERVWIVAPPRAVLGDVTNGQASASSWNASCHGAAHAYAAQGLGPFHARDMLNAHSVFKFEPTFIGLTSRTPAH